MIKLDSIFNYFPKRLREQIADDDQIRSWALQVLKMVKIPNARYIKDIHFDEVVNHKVELPNNLKKIYKVSFAKNPPSDKEFYDFCQCDGTDEPTEVLDEDCTRIYHQLFLDSEYYRSSYRPMSYKGMRLTDNYVCNVNWGDCYGHYSLNSTGKYLTTSESSGYIAIEYFAELMDGEDYLIPDIEELKLAMSHFAEAQYYRNNVGFAEQNSNQLYMQNLQQAKTYLLDARAQLIGQNINVPLHRELINYNSRITKVHRLFRHYD